MRRIYPAIVVIVLMFLTSAGLAQPKCVDLRALNTQTLAVDPLGNGGWNLSPGTTTGVVNWAPLSPNYIEYIPPASGGSKYPNAVAGRYWDFTQVWYFNDVNGNEIGTFTVGSYHASFPLPAGKGGMGNFVGGGKITGGTGIFEGASGSLTETGIYLIWLGEDGWTYGKYNATYVAKICMN
jgi:hypothetical protein